MNSHRQYKYLPFIAMLYVTIKLTTAVLIYKIIYMGQFTASASTFVMPIWFVIGDIIAEVYGYTIARQLIWTAIFCQFIFAFITALLCSFPSPADWVHQDTYEQVLGKLPRVALASFFAIISGAFINAYAISRWKILLSGKYFWLRSLGASAIGEFIFTVIAYFTEFSGSISLSNILHLITISYITKLICGPILVIPAIFIVSALKNAEKIDLYDHAVDFKPFKKL